MEENKMDQITTEMAEYICDKLCQHPQRGLTEDELTDICCECEIGEYVCRILNEYNRINNFEKSQSVKLLETVAELRAEKERVIEQLEDAQSEVRYYEDDYFDGQANAYQSALFILRKGGKDE